MWKIRLILQQNDHKRGTKQLPVTRRLEFDDICAIGLFTTDSCFCNQFQNDERNHKSGCKWRHMSGSFMNALLNLHFVQKMVKTRNKLTSGNYSKSIDTNINCSDFLLVFLVFCI